MTKADVIRMTSRADRKGTGSYMHRPGKPAKIGQTKTE